MSGYTLKHLNIVLVYDYSQFLDMLLEADIHIQKVLDYTTIYQSICLSPIQVSHFPTMCNHSWKCLKNVNK